MLWISPNRDRFILYKPRWAFGSGHFFSKNVKTYWSNQEMEVPHVSIFTGIFVLLFFLYALFNMSRKSGADRRRLPVPPEAGGALPVIGHLHLLSAKEPTHITLAKMADAYGPMFTLRFGMKKALVVSSWEIAREFFTTNDRLFASRPKLVASKLLGYDYAMFGLSPYGPHWRQARRVATLELLTNHRLEKLQHVRILEVKNWIKELYKLCVKSEEKAVVEMKKWFGDLTLDTIFRIVVGKRFSAAFNGSGSEECKKALRDFFELFGIFIPSDSFPFLSWLDLGGHEKAMKHTAKLLDHAFDKFLKDHNQTTNFAASEEADQDFMEVMISAVKNEGESFSYDANTVIKATCLNMILGGFDTTTVTMTWVISLLLNNQETLQKAQLELDEQVGRGREVKESDVKNLLYLQAIVKETLRLYPAAPLLVPHESIEDCTAAGYHIPIGTRLIVNVQKLQRDPLVWEDSCEFRPERFLTSQKNFDVRGQSPQLIPFRNGRRMCPGISFALQVIHLTLANLLHGFKIDRPSEEPLDMEESVGLTSVRKAPLEVVLTPCLPAQVYGKVCNKIMNKK
ncbi:cytochrome P450 CYP82D47-like [Momordica charantia]|uniref:Cytochrome P450 CYP82D47-like n=1 Tax=Momordica charantia TaxID=3673 RepID=A0A6J1C9U5_MOMCH|nr:cytochrome P450 CYP82D47-like [Momordica charantia]